MSTEGEREPQTPAAIQTVAELIAALSRLPPEARVVGEFEGCDWQIDEVATDNDGSVGICLGDRDYESEDRRRR